MLSLGLVLQAVGLKMVLIDDREALAKVEPLYVERDASQARLGNRSRKSAKPKRRKKAAQRQRLWHGRRDPKGSRKPKNPGTASI